MLAAARPGATLIVFRDTDAFDVSDAVTLEPIVTGSTLWDALAAARGLGGAVWRQSLDDGGRPIGDAVLWMPRREDGR